MRGPRPIVCVVLVALGVAGFSVSRSRVAAQGQRDMLAWAPMPIEATKWSAPNRPHWKLAELLAKHQGQKSWTEAVVNDGTLRAEYISMAPGEKTPRRLHPDTRAWWIVQDGQIRFSIDGQEPFVAKKGFLVQVPYRNIYSMETVGDTPSLRLEVNIGGATTMYPAGANDARPASMPGFEFIKVRIGGKGAYDARNKPYVDFNAVVDGTDSTRRFIADDRAVANIIRGKPQQPGPSDKGHFHLESSEFWFILEGQIRYRIGSLPVFLADQGDIVYVPKQTWHLASHGPTPMSTRLAMNGYQDLLHNWEPTEDQTQR